MTAIGTASRVLGWASDPIGSPPSGDLFEAESLARPGTQALGLLRGLAVRTAALLGAGRPPFGDDGPVGLGALLLAAAVGGRTEAGIARRITGGVPALRLLPDQGEGDPARYPFGWADAVARHGVAGSFIQFGLGSSAMNELIDELLAASPLTAILWRPRTEADYKETLETVLSLLARPHGAAVLTIALATPTRDADTLAWRGAILRGLADRHTEVVLGVYLAARVRHGGEWDDLLNWAASAGSRGAAVRRFWLPLAVLDARDPELLRSQPLLEGHRRAIELAQAN